MGPELINAMTDAFNQVSTNVTEVIGIALPVGLGIVAIVLSIKLGINFFKTVVHA